MVRIGIETGSITLAVDLNARFYRIEGPNNQLLFIAPGDRVRIRVVNGQLQVEAIPKGFQFAAEWLFEDWDESILGPQWLAPNELGSQPLWAEGPENSNPKKEAGSTNSLPGSLSPLDAFASPTPAQSPTGIAIDVAPR